MSLSVAALRLCAVKSIVGATSVGGLVFDSVVDPVDLIGDKPQPSIIVYADAGTFNVKDASLFEAAQNVDLTIEQFIGSAVTVDAGTDQSRVELRVAEKDAAHEDYLRALSYEVKKALLRRDGVSPWPDLFRRFWVRGAQDNLSQWDRGANSEHGSRFAFLRTVYRLETVDDPVPGAPLPQLWTDLLAAMAADADLAATADWWRALIVTPAAPTWRQAQEQLGLTDAATAALGEAPVSGTLDDPLPVSSEIAVALADEQGALTVDPDSATIAQDGGAAVAIAEG